MAHRLKMAFLDRLSQCDQVYKVVNGQVSVRAITMPKLIEGGGVLHSKLLVSDRLVICSVIRLGDLLVLGNFLKPLATTNLPKSYTLGIFCKGVKIYHFSREIIFWQLL